MTETETTPAEAIERLTVKDSRSRGQVLVLFALLLTFLLGTCAFVVDLAWIWVNELKVQRAADSAALAGVVHLPGAVGLANSSALDESRFNGYRDSSNNAIQQPAQAVDVWARPDPGDPRKMLVRVQANIDTFFMQIFGFDTLRITRDAKAEYVLPVPMGSPENYYGVFGLLRTPAGGVNVTTAHTLPAAPPPGAVATAKSNSNGCPAADQWTSTPTAATTLVNDVNTSNNQWAVDATNNHVMCFGNFGFVLPGGATVTGVEVRLEAYATDPAGCSLQVDLSFGNAAGSFTTGAGTGVKTLALTGTEPAGQPYSVLGGSSGSNSDMWNHSPWTAAQLTNANFRVRITNLRPAACNVATPAGPPAGQARVDFLQVIVHYTTTVFVPDQNLADPYGGALTPRGLWGTFINQGAEKVNGDAYLPKWDPRTSGTNAEYNPNQYYNYAVEMPAGATSGEVWVFDAPFCATDTGGQYGTGDRYFSGSTAATSAYYTLYDTNNTLFDTSDDTIVSRTNTIFANQQASDTTLNGPGGLSSCAPGRHGQPVRRALLAQPVVPDAEHAWRRGIRHPGLGERGRGPAPPGRAHVPPPHPVHEPRQPHGHGQRERPQLVLDLDQGQLQRCVRRRPPRLWPGRHGGIHPAGRRYRGPVLPGRDRAHPRRQERRDPAVGPRRHRQPVGHAAGQGSASAEPTWMRHSTGSLRGWRLARRPALARPTTT